jgi:hypothetical protein
MSGPFARLFCLVALSSSFIQSAAADQPTADEAEQYAVLRNGEVLNGRIARQGDRFVIATPNSEMRVPAREVDFICQSLDEAYGVQRNRLIAGRIDDHLNLADWCLRQKLLGYAAGEVGKAMEIDPRNSRLAVLDRRLKREQESAQSNSTPKAATPASAAPVANISADELERLVRSLPGNTVETFTSTIQPMLLNSCATAGCHGPSPASKFTLLRPATGDLPQRRLTQRNLYNTLSWVDHAEPADSKILVAAKQPHGLDNVSSAPGLNYAHYQQLAAWVIQATQSTMSQPLTTISSKLPLAESPIPAANGVDIAASPPGIVPDGGTTMAAKISARKPKKPNASASGSPAMNHANGFSPQSGNASPQMPSASAGE